MFANNIFSSSLYGSSFFKKSAVVIHPKNIKEHDIEQQKGNACLLINSNTYEVHVFSWTENIPMNCELLMQ